MTTIPDGLEYAKRYHDEQEQYKITSAKKRADYIKDRTRSLLEQCALQITEELQKTTNIREMFYFACDIVYDVEVLAATNTELEHRHWQLTYEGTNECRFCYRLNFVV